MPFNSKAIGHGLNLNSLLLIYCSYVGNKNNQMGNLKKLCMVQFCHLVNVLGMFPHHVFPCSGST
jgi:hypothetical protein